MVQRHVIDIIFHAHWELTLGSYASALQVAAVAIDPRVIFRLLTSEV